MEKRFNEGERVYMEGRGFGTVTSDTYQNIHFTTYTTVKWDDYLGQKFSLAENTAMLIPAKHTIDTSEK
ncbi:hypothetical protein ACFVS2_21065 [Brevibacillus sp. NPDC058079]|uniref:hypothetical protein n=1 Tax=Brevibacillus sp. NPDC058079 TaxID=3346330 RepID=UPI0036E6DD42